MAAFFNKLLRAIPEAFYDLIARILPGGVVVAAVLMRSQNVPINLEVTANETIVFLAFAYAVGLATSTLVHLVHLPTWPLIYRCLERGGVRLPLEAHVQKSLDPGLSIDRNSGLKAEAFLDRVLDHIKQVPKERPVIVKLLAEASLLYSMFIAFAVAMLTTVTSVPTLVSIGLGAAAIMFFAAGFVRSARVWFRAHSILAAITTRQAAKREKEGGKTSRQGQ
jgi:hypothetical protein